MKYLKFAVLLCLLSTFSFAQASKLKPSATPVKRPIANEKAQFDAASAIVPPDQRAEALAKFVELFPKSTRLAEALEMLASARVDSGNAKLNAGDVDGAANVFKRAAADAPKPISDKLWDESLRGISSKVYFAGAREAAYAIASSLEEKADGNAKQLLGLASFYLGVEDGTKGQRVAEKIVALDPNSTLGYQALGFAHRVNFELEDAAAAFTKALELEPESTSSRRSLADLKRALGKPDEAAALYREAIAKDENDLASETGLVLALFDAGKRGDAEAELAKALSMNDGNVMLLGNVAYWYAVQGDGDKAIELATKAIDKDPRFIWSHIALAHGFLLKGQTADAEKTLLTARRYGNFPALTYELAAAKAAGGYYREAAEELSKAFAVKDGVISTKLGGRVVKGSKDFTELVGLERRASIFAPTAADDPDSASRLAALLEFTQVLADAEPNADAITRTADSFTAGSDKMRIFRQLYVANELLEKRTALTKILDIMRAAASGVDAAAEMPGASSATMASELYVARATATNRGEFIDVPPVGKTVVASILRGRIEDISGWTEFQMDRTADAVTRLRRAVGVLPVDSAWWRASLWHLGTALAASGKDQEALDAYVKAYKSGGPDALKYIAIRGLYVRINGKPDGLDSLVGEDPMADTAAVATPTPTVSPTPDTSPTPTVTSTPESSPIPTIIPTPEASPTPTVEPSPTPTPSTPEAQPEAKPTPVDASACNLTSSEDVLTLASTGGDLAIMISVDQGSLDDLKATPSSTADISVTREIIAGVKSRAVFVVRSASGKTGDYSIKFEMPCGSKGIPVHVR